MCVCVCVWGAAKSTHLGLKEGHGDGLENNVAAVANAPTASWPLAWTSLLTLPVPLVKCSENSREHRAVVDVDDDMAAPDANGAARPRHDQKHPVPTPA